MYPLASQSFPASAQPVEALSMADVVTTTTALAPKGAANDNPVAWKPSLLVQRRRRLTRRAVRS